VPGVTAVIDGGLQKVARYDAERGIDSLETERITLGRRGISARDEPAGCPRASSAAVDARDRLRPHREPEIHRIDLAERRWT